MTAGFVFSIGLAFYLGRHVSVGQPIILHPHIQFGTAGGQDLVVSGVAKSGEAATNELGASEAASSPNQTGPAVDAAILQNVPLPLLRKLINEREAQLYDQAIAPHFDRPKGEKEEKDRAEQAYRVVGPIFDQSIYWTALTTIDLPEKSHRLRLLLDFYASGATVTNSDDLNQIKEPANICWTLIGYFVDLEGDFGFGTSSCFSWLGKRNDRFMITASLSETSYEHVQTYIENIAIGVPTANSKSASVETLDTKSHKWIEQRAGVSWAPLTKEERAQLEKEYRRK